MLDQATCQILHSDHSALNVFSLHHQRIYLLLCLIHCKDFVGTFCLDKSRQILLLKLLDALHCLADCLCCLIDRIRRLLALALSELCLVLFLMNSLKLKYLLEATLFKLLDSCKQFSLEKTVLDDLWLLCSLGFQSLKSTSHINLELVNEHLNLAHLLW